MYYLKRTLLGCEDQSICLYWTR